MASTLDTIMETLIAIVFSPMILPIADAIKEPLVQNTIKDSILLSEKIKDAVIEITETAEKVTADARKEEIESCKFKSYKFIDQSTSYQNDFTNGHSESAKKLINLIYDINKDVAIMTNNIADLRVILPLGMGLLSLRQLLRKGLQLEEIPWYILAWYSFDMFTRLNFEDETLLANLSINTVNNVNNVSMEFEEQENSYSNNTQQCESES